MTRRSADRSLLWSDLLIAAGLMTLTLVGSFWIRKALLASQPSSDRRLEVTRSIRLPLLPPVELGGSDPAALVTSSQVAVVEPGDLTQEEFADLTSDLESVSLPGDILAAAPDEAVPASAVQAGSLAVPTDVLNRSPLTSFNTRLVVPTPAGMAYDSRLPTAALPPIITVTPDAPPLPSIQPAPANAASLLEFSAVIRVVIPTLKIDRAVVPVGMRPNDQGELEWDTDSLFATRNRRDLVGHLVGSAAPGQGGNIQLVGHNYNDTDYAGWGVFVAIKTLVAGDEITLFTEDGRRTAYRVEIVKQFNWDPKDEVGLEKHLKLLGPTGAERLTLVTCGGANLWPFPTRVYVVAVPRE